ncbi:MAG: response regulator [Chloroflexi bacterium]|nr:MAG: response regulator [Chloroflexota bacterium]
MALAASEKPDLVMVDGMMPEIDGWEVCRRLRDDKSLAHIPIIMFSAVEEAEQKLAGFNAGADDYLTKPTEPEEMIERVEALLADVPPREKSQEKSNAKPLPPQEDLLKTRKVDLRTPAAPLGRTTGLASQTNLIVVVGARGGAGTTTMSINLAASLAHIGVPTTLVDLDLTQGHIALYLKQKASRNINHLANLATGKLKVQYADAITAYEENLQLMLARTNLLDQRKTLSVNQVNDLVHSLVQPGHCVVVDVGRGVTAVTRPLLEQADQIIVCLRPERVSLAAAKKLIIRMKELLFSHTSLGAVLFDFVGGREIPQKAIESYLGQSMLAIVPIQSQEMAQAVNKGIPLVHLQAESHTSIIFRRLAHQMVKTA